MKILLILALSIFSLGAFADDCQVQIDVEGVGTQDVGVCEIKGAKDSADYKDAYVKCDCDNKVKPEVAGNATTIKHCDTDRITPSYEYSEDKKKYIKSGGTAQ